MALLAQKVEALAKDLIEEGVLTADQLAVAQESQKNLGKSLSEILVRRGFITEKELIKKLGKKFGLTVMSLATYKPDPDVLKLVSGEQARRWNFFPLFEIEDKITVATADPFNLNIIDEACSDLSHEIECILCIEAEVQDAILKYYGAKKNLGESQADVQVIKSEMEELEKDESPAAQLEREAQATKVVTAINQLLETAVRSQASDLHLEPSRTELKARLRVDGILEELQSFPKSMHQAMISRVKIMGTMDVAERRISQDGRVRIKVKGKSLDLRIASYPTMFGEAIAIRFLSKDSLISLTDLGFLEHDKKSFEEIIQKPHGIFLVTGPTGSGKTTTLYAALQKIDRRTKHVLSVEDPVENEIEGVSQTQINLKAGVTFASVLRAMLRQDPDIIMVGEIRDQETADIALRAAMTGHLVFSTLHTNTAVGAIARLVDLEVEPYLIASTILGVMAQRLARKICPSCKTEAQMTANEKMLLGPKAEGIQVFKGKGCRDCRMTGYKGRIGLFELIEMNDELRVLVNNKSPEVRMQERAIISGSHTIMEDGIEKIRQGLTTVDEVIRVAAQV